MKDKEFRKIYGWDNRETHQVVLYLQNDLYCIFQDLRNNSKNWIEFSDKIKELFYELRDNILDSPNDEQTIRMLFYIGSFPRVNWRQVGKSLY